MQIPMQKRSVASLATILLSVMVISKSSLAERVRIRPVHTVEEAQAAGDDDGRMHAETGFAYKGHIDFTPAEIKTHRKNLPALIFATNATMKAQIDFENQWFNRCGMGVMYGYLSPYGLMKPAARQTYIDQNAHCAQPPTLNDVAVTSCEMFANKFIAKGFAAIGQAPVYKRIDKFLNDNDRDGLALVLALQKLGWKVLYWNNDLNTLPPLTDDRRPVGETLADHIYDMNMAMKKRTYYAISIDGYLTNFSPNTGSHTAKDTSVLNKLKKVPYFIGISHAGFHVWSGAYGVITESHSFFDPNDARNIQVGDFDPLHASPTCRELPDANGVVRKYCYYSGVIAVPPGPWSWL